MTSIRFVTGKSSGILSDISSGILSAISSGILSGISSGIQPGISSAICSGISSGTLSGISSGIFWHIFWHSIRHSIWQIFWHMFWQTFWHFIWHTFWHSIWHSIWHTFWHSIWRIFWHSTWHIFWHMFWQIFWHFIRHIFWHIFWHSILSSIWYIFWHSIWPLRSSGAHWAGKLAKSLATKWRWKLMQTWSRRNWRRRRRARALIKSNNPHLAGGEKHVWFYVIKWIDTSIYIYIYINTYSIYIYIYNTLRKLCHKKEPTSIRRLIVWPQVTGSPVHSNFGYWNGPKLVTHQDYTSGDIPIKSLILAFKYRSPCSSSELPKINHTYHFSQNIQANITDGDEDILGPVGKQLLDSGCLVIWSCHKSTTSMFIVG